MEKQIINMEGVFDNFNMKVGEVKKLGLARLSTFEFSNKKNPLFNLRAIRDGGLNYMNDGKYIRLNVDGELMMTDTKMEMVTNTDFCNNANGRVMVAGLGIGLILQNIKDKVKSGVVTEIVIIEKYQDVIDLVSPIYADMPITYICADILEYKPLKDEIFDTIYFDIWAIADFEVNLPQISMLHNRWKYNKNKSNPKCWMNSWMQKWMQKENRDYRA